SDFGDMASIERGREAIALAEVLEERAAHLFAKAVQPSGHIEAPGVVTVEAMKRLLEHFVAEGKSGLAALDNGAKFIPHAFNSTDSQFIENRRFQISEIAPHFNVPPTMLFDLERGTWSNVEQLHLQFRQFTMSPWLR